MIVLGRAKVGHIRYQRVEVADELHGIQEGEYVNDRRVMATKSQLRSVSET